MKICEIDRRRFKRNVMVFYRETMCEVNENYINPRKKIKIVTHPFSNINNQYNEVEIYCGTSLLALYSVKYKFLIKCG